MKKQLNERFQELAGIKPLQVTEISLNEADHYGFLKDKIKWIYLRQYTT